MKYKINHNNVDNVIEATSFEEAINKYITDKILNSDTLVLISDENNIGRQYKIQNGKAVIPMITRPALVRSSPVLPVSSSSAGFIFSACPELDSSIIRKGISASCPLTESKTEPEPEPESKRPKLLRRNANALEGVISISNLLINNISELNVKFDMKSFNENIRAKIENYKQYYLDKINHVINGDNYDDIFITSDIHADYLKLIQILDKSGLITFPEGIDYVKDIYNPSLITNCEWNKSRTLIIIVGDLVDGKRCDMSVSDRNGSYELLIHALIYNLRLKGLSRFSRIEFTIGNHDLDLMGDPIYLAHYLHDTALNYFKKRCNRKIALIPFYEISPYTFIRIKTLKNENEIICVHAGLHGKKTKDDGSQVDNYKDESERLQQEINKNGLNVLIKILSPVQQNIYNNFYGDNKNFDGLLWTRFYAENPREACGAINSILPNSLIVVGHCPTNINKSLNDLMMLELPLYADCDKFNKPEKKGCVITTCNNPSHMPSLFFVDTSLSEAFRKPKIIENIDRGVEILHLQNNASINLSTRRFNTILREVIYNDKQETINVFPPISRDIPRVLSNISMHKYLKYKKKYILLKNKILQ
jgi:hypothetical protein